MTSHVAAMLAMSEGDSVPLLMEEGADEMEQARAWRAVDSVRVSVDLSLASAQLLRLLRRVDRRGDLYLGPAVAKAIQRYNTRAEVYRKYLTVLL